MGYFMRARVRVCVITKIAPTSIEWQLYHLRQKQIQTEAHTHTRAHEHLCDK